MSAEAARILHDAMALPEADRRRVAEALLDSMPPESAEEIELAWFEEACRRADKLNRGETRVRDGETVLREIAAKLRA